MVELNAWLLEKLTEVNTLKNKTLNVEAKKSAAKEPETRWRALVKKECSLIRNFGNTRRLYLQVLTEKNKTKQKFLVADRDHQTVAKFRTLGHCPLQKGAVLVVHSFLFAANRVFSKLCLVVLGCKVVFARSNLPLPRHGKLADCRAAVVALQQLADAELCTPCSAEKKKSATREAETLFKELSN